MAKLGSKGETARAEEYEQTPRRIGLASHCALAFILGLVTGLGAVAFRDLIGLIHNLMFLGEVAVRYDANVFTPPSPWGARHPGAGDRRRPGYLSGQHFRS